MFPCNHILSALPKSLKRARKVNYVLYKHSKTMSMKIRVNNSLTTKHSMSKGWDFCVSRVVAVPVAGWQWRCVGPWETWPGEFPGRRAKRGRVSVGRVVTHLAPPNASRRSTAQPLETVRSGGQIPQLAKISAEKRIKIALCKTSLPSLSHSWEDDIRCSVNASWRNLASRGQIWIWTVREEKLWHIHLASYCLLIFEDGEVFGPNVQSWYALSHFSLFLWLYSHPCTICCVTLIKYIFNGKFLILTK